MLMVGGGEDEERLQKLIEELGLKKNVILTGKVMDRGELCDIYSSADLFVFPSVYDNAPLVVREAAACGVASLLIKGSNSAEGIIDGVNGVLAEEKVEDIALALYEAISVMDLKNIGENARDSIYISWEDVIEKAVNEYERILKGYKKKDKTKTKRGEKLYDIDPIA